MNCPALRPPPRLPNARGRRCFVLALALAAPLAHGCSGFVGGGSSEGIPAAGTAEPGDANEVNLPGSGNDVPALPTTPTEPTPAGGGGNELPLTANPNAAGNANLPLTNPNAVMGPAEVSALGNGNFTVGPSFVADANLTALAAGVPAGTWSTFYVPGANSAYYTGQAPGLKQSVTINRQVQVFVPSQYVPSTPAPLLVLMDGGDFQYTLKNTLPNLIAAKALPPLVAITVSAGSAAGTYNQRSYEYDVVSTRWSDYVENEILPLVQSKYSVRITNNPALRGTLGGSSGGAAAFTMGWLHPDRYGRLVTFSASLVQLWPTDDYPKGAWFYPSGGIAAAAKKNLRISLMVSQNDLNAGSNGANDWRLANQNAAAALAAKGYPLRYTYVVGGGHEEPGALRQSLPDQLAWAWRGWEQAIP